MEFVGLALVEPRHDDGRDFRAGLFVHLRQLHAVLHHGLLLAVGAVDDQAAFRVLAQFELHVKIFHVVEAHEADADLHAIVGRRR